MGINIGKNKSIEKIALVTIHNALTQSPPLNLLCLSAVLEREGFRTDIFDLAVSPDKENELFAGVGAGEYLWVGFTASTPAVPVTKKCIDKTRQINQRIPIIVGGVHSSSLPEQTLRELDIDAVCIGDGLDSSVALSRKIQRNEADYWNIPGIASFDEHNNYRFSEELARSIVRKPLPRPDWNKIDIGSYQKCPIQYIRRKKVIAPVITASGCPCKCSFCAVPSFSGRVLVRQDPTTVVDEIEYLVTQKGVEEIHIYDDNFNYDLVYAKSVLNEILERNIKFVWKAPVGFGIHSYDDDLLSLLVRSGCYQIGFGIESGSAEILKNVKKGIHLEKISSILAKYRAKGISTFGFFILGLPGESRETIQRTIRFACSLPLDHVNVSLFTPYPGSPLFQEFFDQGKLDAEWEDYYHYHKTDKFTACDLPVEVLRRAMQYFYLRFYSRPGRAFNLLNDVRRTGLMPFLSLARTIYS